MDSESMDVSKAKAAAEGSKVKAATDVSKVAINAPKAKAAMDVSKAAVNVSKAKATMGAVDRSIHCAVMSCLDTQPLYPAFAKTGCEGAK